MKPTRGNTMKPTRGNTMKKAAPKSKLGKVLRTLIDETAQQRKPALKMGDFTINKGVPIPPRRGRPQSYPFAQMQVGDSFECDVALAPNARRAATKYKSRYPNSFNYTARTQSNGNVRVWRTEV